MLLTATLTRCETQVGNDAVDQLVKFNRSLSDLAPGGAASAGSRRPVIDGILLTKFDTIDDKVGRCSWLYMYSKHSLMTGAPWSDDRRACALLTMLQVTILLRPRRPDMPAHDAICFAGR